MMQYQIKIDKEFHVLCQAAVQGQAEAQYKLAVYYRDSRNGKQAIKWYRKAAEQGHAGARLALKKFFCLV